jgi:hypothetical protein
MKMHGIELCSEVEIPQLGWCERMTNFRKYVHRY